MYSSGWIYNRKITNERKRLTMNSQTPFQLCFFGTTSSGKTTFVNGLLGESILTSDLDEVSAGWVQIENGNSYELKIEGNDYWNPTFYQSTDPELIKLKILSLTNLYYALKKETKISDSPIINLKTNFNFTYKLLDSMFHYSLIDLPGVKNTKDSQLESILQQQFKTKNNNSSIPFMIVDVTALHQYESIEYLVDMIIKYLNSQNIIIILNKYDCLPDSEQNIEIHKNKLKFLHQKFPYVNFSYIKFYSQLLLWGTSLEKSILNHTYEIQKMLMFNLNYYKPLLKKHSKYSVDKIKLNHIEQCLDLGDPIDSSSLLWFAKTLINISGIDEIRYELNSKLIFMTPFQTFLKKIKCIESLLDKIIESDHRILSQELKLKKILLHEFQTHFYPSFNNFAIDHLKIHEKYNYHKISLEQNPLTLDEKKWCIMSFYTLITIDGKIDPQEVRVLKNIERSFYGIE
jgi:GTPase SAR1 family protein